jgi:hypothetical protein
MPDFNSKLRDEFLVSEWRDLQLDEGAARAGRTVENPLQHGEATLLTGLTAPGATSVPGHKQPGYGEEESKQRFPFSTPPTATAMELQSKPLRSTNNQTGAKDRADQLLRKHRL